MNVLIYRGKVSLPPETADEIRKRIRYALDRFERRIRTLRVRFDDLNGPRSGTDKQCIIEATCDRRAPLVVKEVSADSVAAAAGAARKLARRIVSNSQRLHDTHHSHSGKNLAANAPEENRRSE